MEECFPRDGTAWLDRENPSIPVGQGGSWSSKKPSTDTPGSCGGGEINKKEKSSELTLGQRSKESGNHTSSPAGDTMCKDRTRGRTTSWPSRGLCQRMPTELRNGVQRAAWWIPTAPAPKPIRGPHLACHEHTLPLSHQDPIWGEGGKGRTLKDWELTKGPWYLTDIIPERKRMDLRICLVHIRVLRLGGLQERLLKCRLWKVILYFLCAYKLM